MSFTSPEKEFFIYDVIVKQKYINGPVITTDKDARTLADARGVKYKKPRSGSKVLNSDRKHKPPKPYKGYSLL